MFGNMPRIKSRFGFGYAGPRSICTAWDFAYAINKYVDKDEVWNIILQIRM